MHSSTMRTPRALTVVLVLGGVGGWSCPVGGGGGGAVLGGGVVSPDHGTYHMMHLMSVIANYVKYVNSKILTAGLCS